MKVYRKNIFISDKDYYRATIDWFDLYSLSAFHELLFHIQEHRFLFSRIQNCLALQGYNFCGFDLTHFMLRTKKANPIEDTLYDLFQSGAYKGQYPRIFSGVGQFWRQKSID